MGEIAVESDVGTVIVNQAFQATHVETLKSSPLNPILLDLSESMINNLLIITPPEELEDETTNDIVNRITSELDLDLLEFQELNRDYLAELEKDQWMTDLDFDPRLPAVYYMRVLEIPTPTWQAYDMAYFGNEMPAEVPRKHQERAYTSPIWYTP